MSQKKENAVDGLRIEYLSVGALKPAERNARKHTESDVQAIVESIKEFGFSDPIGIWGGGEHYCGGTRAALSGAEAWHD